MREPLAAKMTFVLIARVYELPLTVMGVATASTPFVMLVSRISKNAPCLKGVTHSSNGVCFSIYLGFLLCLLGLPSRWH